MRVRPKNGWVWIGGGIVLVVVIAVVIGLSGGCPDSANLATIGSIGGCQQYVNPPPAAPVIAPQGKLTSGFPKNLILDSAAGVTQSYSVHYAASLGQYTAAWNSSSSMQSLYVAYQTYFTKNNWLVKNESVSSASLRSIYAIDGSNDAANVVIVPQGTGSQITISYVTP